MSDKPLGLTRNQLAEFLPNARAVRAFEQLLKSVGDLIPADIEKIYSLINESYLEGSIGASKAQEALDQLAAVANAIQLSQLSPPANQDNKPRLDYVDFSSVAPQPVGAVGRMSWNDTEGTLDLGLKGGNVTLQIGQESVLLVKNDDTVTLTDGMVVYVSGASGANVLVKRALANSDITSASTIGIVTEHIAVNAQGFVTTFGAVRGLNTNAFNEGDPLYLSPTTAGLLTNVKPVAPQHMVTIGFCTKKSGGNGEVFVSVNNGYEIDELHNVLITDPVTAGSLLIYDATVNVWKNARLTAGTNVSITNADGSITINSSNPGGTVTSVGLSAPTGFSVTGSPVTSSGTLALAFAAGYSLPTNTSQSNWDTAYADRNKWDGGSTGLVAATGRTSLGATTVGSNLFTLANPSAITFLRVNADNTVSALDAATFRTAIGAGTGGGTVTSVAALTLGTTGTDLSSTVANGTTTPVITLNVPTASTTNRGALSSTDWSTFNGKQAALVSGTNIKTVGGVSLLGSGDLGTIGAGYGGTGQSSYAVGDLLYASASTTLSKLAAVATGNVLISGGVTTAPAWGKVGLTTHVTGTLAVGNGGTGTATAFTAGSVVFAGASGTYSQNNSSFFWDNTNGRLGIQTTTPNTWLTVRMSHTPPSSTAYNSGIQIHDEPNGVIPHFNAGVAYDGGANYGWIQVNNSTYGAYNLVLQLAGGATLIGTTSSYFGARAAIVASGAQYTLEVQANNSSYYTGIITNTATSGDNRFLYFGTEANGATQRGSIIYNRATGLVMYNTTSDYRSKKILGLLEDSGSVIDQLKIYSGLMNGASVARPMLIAHEAQVVTPYAVTGEKDAVDEEGKPVFQQMDHASYVPMILAELQQIRKRLTQLEN
jgi:hypothetical protein